MTRIRARSRSSTSTRTSTFSTRAAPRAVSASRAACAARSSWNALGLERVSAAHSIQVGVRNFNFPASRRFIEEVGLAQLPAAEFHRIGTEAAAERIRARLAGADHVFWAFDIDVVDPSAAPGAGAHEPGGLTSRQALDCVRLLAGGCEGLSLVEVNPLLDHRDQTSILAANLAFAYAVFGQDRA